MTLRGKVFVLALIVLGLIGCAAPKAHYTLASNYKWPIGEARGCTLYRALGTGDCFVPTHESEEPGTGQLNFLYSVSVSLDKSSALVNENNGTIQTICRLDSYEHATCQGN